MVAFGNLRTKLVVSHLAVIGLVFVLTVLVASIPIRQAQRGAEESRLSTYAETVALQIDFATRPASNIDREAVLQGLISRQAQRSNTHILLASTDGTIMLDSDPSGSYVGRRIDGLDDQIQAVRDLARRQELAAPIARALTPLGVTRPVGTIDRHIAVVATTTDSNDRDDALYTVVVSPRARIAIFDRYVRPLLFSAGLAALIGVGASLWIAGSIASPITRLTETAGAINAGNLDARAVGGGDDEVGRLVRAFNAMIERLSATYASQRTLLANIAHELRTPLTSIQGYAQALRDDVLRDPGERDEALRVIGEESQRIDELVNQVLQLSRLESGQLPLRIEPTDLGTLMERLTRSLAPQARDAGVTIANASSAGVAVSVDPELVTQASGNLATNALRHTPPGGTITIRAGWVVGAGGNRVARLTVTDTGAGIDPADLPHLFDRFYRGSPDAESGGVSGAGDAARRFGLGLAITHQIVARHGGTIAVESVPGRGTTFTIDLPADRDQPGASPSRA